MPFSKTCHLHIRCVQRAWNIIGIVWILSGATALSVCVYAGTPWTGTALMSVLSLIGVALGISFDRCVRMDPARPR